MVSIEDTKPSHYVGIGASAGGLEAIETFFKEMPIDSGAAFIVVQHLSPDYKSLMTELLSKRTAMPVHRIEDGMEVKANNVYLIPPRKNLTIFQGHLLLSDQEVNRGINLPIDIFFNSLAEDQGPKAIAIELSGTGSDGARGVRAIKEADGLVMVQSEESAQFDGMPRSVIALGIADFILAPDEMATQLTAFIKHPASRGEKPEGYLQMDEDALMRIYALLRDVSKIDFTYYKPATVLRRIERRMTANQFTELNDYVRYLETHRNEVNILYREMLIGVTSFFRDQEAFETLNKYLPELLGSMDRREIRIWSAGCSTGEEAYTIAILCLEVMEQLGIHKEVKIFATDVDHYAIENAGAGRFTESIVLGVPQELLSKYFVRHEDSYQIARHVRQMVVFAQHNLVKDPPFTNIDLISCRNLLIYLQPVLQRKALELFNFSLREGGIMFLGSSETIGEMSEYYEPLDRKWRIYRSRGKRRPIDMAINPVLHVQSRSSSYGPAGPMVKILSDEEKVLDRFLQTFADDFVRFAMVINSDMNIIHAIGDTKQFLHMQPGLVTMDATKLITKEFSIPLSTGVQKVIEREETLSFSKIFVDLGDGQKSMMQMRIKLLPYKKGQNPLVGVFINEMNTAAASEESNDVKGITFDISREAQERIGDLEQELQFTRENLQATVEELETSNEELQATNEELLASNEELQSTNEELQSVNEELFTVNAEYQSKITELTVLNNDLDNLLSSTSIGTLFLDEDLEIRRYSSNITELINIIGSDLGRPISHISHHLGELDLSKIANETLANFKMSEYEFATDHGRYYLLRALPYQIASEVYDGVVLIFIDITERKKTEHALHQSQERYRLAQHAANMVAWEWHVDTDQFYWSSNMRQIFGLDANVKLNHYNDCLALLYPDEREQVDQLIKRTVKEQSEFKVEHRLVQPSGDIIWLQSTGRVYPEANGQPMRLVGISQDVTSRKTAEIELTTYNEDGRKVLIVDDSPEMVNLITELVTTIDDSLHVITASNGFDGLIQAGRHNPDLIITDLVMPDLDGFRMIELQKKDPVLKHTETIVISALSVDEINKRGGLPEDVHHILKPFDNAVLREKLAETLGISLA